MIEEPTNWRSACEAVLEGLTRWHRIGAHDLPETFDEMADVLLPTDPAGTYVILGLRAYGELRAALPYYASDYAVAAMREQLVDLWCSKQADYGHGNILKFGHTGIVIRMSDKVERLRNLARHGYAERNESVMDSWRDLLGYAVIGIMLEMNLFTLPLPLAYTLAEWDDFIQRDNSTDPLVRPRHDPVYACGNHAPTTAGCHIFPDGWKPTLEGSYPGGAR